MTDAKGAAAPGIQCINDARQDLLLQMERLLSSALAAYSGGFIDDALTLAEAAGDIAIIISELRESGDG